MAELRRFHQPVDFNDAVTKGGVAIPTISSTDTLTNKTLTSPTITGPTISGTVTLAPQIQTIAADGAITLPTTALTVVKITKASAAAVTLADPAAAQEGCILVISAQTAAAHTVSNAAGSGFNGGGAGADVGTFGGAIGDGFVLVAVNTKWNVVVLRNVTLG